MLHRPRPITGVVSRETARATLGVDDDELNRLIVSKAIPAPIIDSSGRERFFMSEIRQYVERSRIITA